MDRWIVDGGVCATVFGLTAFAMWQMSLMLFPVVWGRACLEMAPVRVPAARRRTRAWGINHPRFQSGTRDWMWN